MPYSMNYIAGIVKGRLSGSDQSSIVEYITFDSRKVQQSGTSLFVALATEHNDGHLFITDAYQKGVRKFLISNPNALDSLGDVTIIIVEDTLRALQELAAHHRSRFNIPVIGITGSNGKTIVKEWLYQLLQESNTIVRSPRSYNSQVGVPLSVWQINRQHTLAIFEAGISGPGEMQKLEAIIRPTIGILTNIGEAHDGGFSSRAEKLNEKLKLFQHTEILIAPHGLIENAGRHIISWGSEEEATLRLTGVSTDPEQTVLRAVYDGAQHSITIPFTDEASIQNAISCWCVLLYLRLPHDAIDEKFRRLHAVDMRMQLKHGINGCLIVNDSYSADTTSLRIALDFLQQQSSGMMRTVIISDLVETGKSDEMLYAGISELLGSHRLHKIITVGEKIRDHLTVSDSNIILRRFTSTEEFIHHFRSSDFSDEIILVKGARRFGFENIVRLFEQKMHQTVLEINLNALAHNLKQYQKLLNPGTKVMAMVKAFSYGSGSAEIASVLQFHNVDFLAVAYADEGVELVQSGIRLPIMVMNAEESSFDSIVEYNLQPVLYSFELLKKFQRHLKDQAIETYPVHIELETGMNRLGFLPEEINKLAAEISVQPFSVRSVFTHLAASEDAGQDEFTLQQFERFQQATSVIQAVVPYNFLRHISNSAAIVRHPKLQLDMVRLGIGLYGVEPDAANNLELETVGTLRSTIAQVKRLKKGESVSYNRRGVLTRDSVIATIRIGYADGYSRQFGNGVGHVRVRTKLVPVIGTVCMDMTMVDVTDVEGVAEGDDVIIFGPQLPVQQLAKWINTIPYEIMTGVSQRVKRVYYFE